MKAKRTVIALFATGAAVAMLVALMPSVVAQTAAFGTQVKYGDNDFVPTIRSTGVASTVANAFFNGRINVTRVDFGTAGDVTDDCFYLRQDNTTSTTNAVVTVPVVRTYDVRLVVSSGCAGKTVGTLVMDTDTAEKGQAHAQSALIGSGAGLGVNSHRQPRVVYADVNNNNRYDFGDCAFITAGPRGVNGDANTANQAASLNATANDRYTIRLTPCAGKAAGTLVFSGEPDFTSYGTGNSKYLNPGAIRAGMGIFDADNSGTFTPGDRMYINTTASVAAAFPSPQLIPMNSIRIVGDAGQFGSQVKLGDNDFKPLIGSALALAHTIRVARVDYGTSGDVTDDCFYMRTPLHSATTTIQTYDVRLVVNSGCSGKTVGSLVSDTDSSEKGQANFTGIAGTGAHVVFADVNNNNRYDMGDCVFVQSGAGGTGVAISATTNTNYAIRLTPCSGKAAGTLVFSGEPDFTSYGATGVSTLTFHMGAFDADLSGNVNPGDRIYVNATSASGLVPLYSIRIVGDAGQFGTQAKFGDSDFIPTMTLSRQAEIARVDFGTSGDITDDCYYLRPNFAGPVPATNAVGTYDVRMVVASGCAGKTVGSLVADTDSAEKGQANATGTLAAGSVVRTVYADVNNNNRYDMGDCVFASQGPGTTGVINASSTAAFTVRLTPCSGKAAGTLVFSGEPDFVSYGASGGKNPNGGTVLSRLVLGIFDADRSGTYTPGDRLYSVFNATATTGGLVPQFAVRLVGDFTTGGGGGSASPVTSAVTSAVTSNVASTSTKTTTATTPTTGGSGSSSPAPSTKKTPGLELVAVLAGVAVVVAVVSRRKK